MNKIGKTITTRLKDLQLEQAKFGTGHKRNQAWLAEEVGVSNNAVSKWKKEGKIKRENIPAVARALGISIDQLMSDDDTVASIPISESKLDRLDAAEAEVLNIFREVNETGKQMIAANARLVMAQHMASQSPRARNKT